MDTFDTFPSRSLDNGFIHIKALVTAGPRILHLSTSGGPNLLAMLTPNEKRATPYGDYYFMGGHRLWHAPEALPRTYIPDTDGLVCEELPDGLRLHRPTEAGTGISKTMDIHLVPGRAAATLVHSLKNDGLWEVELAPWALTTFKLGGTAILPQPVGNSDPDGLLHNRLLAIWPYTRINEPRLVLRDDFILIKATSSLPPLKIGYANPRGWLGYYIDGVLFRMTFDVTPGATYPDGGCNTESYCDARAIELETLGPLVRLAPGASVTFNETWELFPSIEQPFLPEEIRALIEQ